MVRAYIGGLLLDGTDNPATYTISEDGLKGWWSGVSSDVPTTKRPQMHGEFQGNGTLDGRLITIEGIIHSVDDQGADINAISSVLADGSLGLLLIEEPSGSKWAYVRRVGEPDTKILVYGKTAAYQVRFRARDPRRYSTGEWQSTPPPSPGAGLVFPAVWPAKWPGGGATGRVTLPNDGHAPSPVSLVLTGGFSSALITCVESGARIGFARPIPSGTSVVIQTDDTGVARRATLNGQDVSRWLRYREWTDVPGLMSRTFQLQVTDPVGMPTLAGKVDHAWW